MIKVKYICENWDPTYEHERESRDCNAEGIIELDMTGDEFHNYSSFEFTQECESCKEPIFSTKCEIVE